MSAERGEFALAQARKHALTAAQKYRAWFALRDKRLEYELSQGYPKTIAERRAVDYQPLKDIAGDEQFAERLTNMWANVAQAEYAQDASWRLQALSEVLLNPNGCKGTPT